MDLCLAGDFCGRMMILFFQGCGLGFVDAERLFRQVISSGSVGAGAAAHTDVAEFAAAAFAGEVVYVAQFVEHDRVLPDIRKALFLEISGEGGKISAGIHFALIGDEAHGGSGEAAFGHSVHIGGMSAGMTDSASDALGLEFDAGGAGHGHVDGPDGGGFGVVCRV